MSMRFAYADPPYLGCSRLYDHENAKIWDDLETHLRLVRNLTAEYTDGWALSLSAPSLRHILPACPENARIGVWCKTFSAFKKGVRPAYAWEPVIFCGGRNPPGHSHPPPEKGGRQTTPKDFLETKDFTGSIGVLSPITLKKGLTGAKPEMFCRWVLDLLNAKADDFLADLFPGTGIMWEVAKERGMLLWQETHLW
ncbi:MAG: hypothetical protein ACYSWU_05140 [Planctomycetota bacterium]|jgi:hypothetical protein